MRADDDVSFESRFPADLPGKLCVLLYVTPVDVRKTPKEEAEKRKVIDALAWKLNNTQPRTEEYAKVQQDLFDDNIGENSSVIGPIHGVCYDKIKIGKNVFINSNLLAMARGGITIEDNVQIAANVQLITTICMTAWCCSASRS